MEENIEQFWRDATSEDVAMVMRCKTVEARFRDNTDKKWKHALLSGWSKIDKSDSLQWAASEGTFWRFCQVYDPPEWYVNKPDPGKGYRLLEKFPVEDKLATDEQWSNFCGKWMHQSSGRHVDPRIDKLQVDKVWYRRRIDTNNPEIPDSSNSSETPNSSRSRDTIPSGWRVLGKDEERLASDAYWSSGYEDWIVIGDGRAAIANESPRWHAIRQVVFPDYHILRVDHIYGLPNGQTIRITEKGFELAID